MKADERDEIKQECLHWLNNCGNCETCTQEFSNPPLYNHQETLEFICDIEKLENKIKKFTEALQQYKNMNTSHIEAHRITYIAERVLEEE